MQVVTLTVKGRTLWEQMHAEYRLVIEELLTRLSKTESKSLTESLILVQKKIDSVLQQEEPQ